MPYKQEVTNSNFPQKSDLSTKNKSVVTEAGVGPILNPEVLSDFIASDLATQAGQKGVNARHIRQSKESGYSDKEAEHTRNL